jgi:hypothetical protein
VSGKSFRFVGLEPPRCTFGCGAPGVPAFNILDSDFSEIETGLENFSIGAALVPPNLYHIVDFVRVAVAKFIFHINTEIKSTLDPISVAADSTAAVAAAISFLFFIFYQQTIPLGFKDSFVTI